MVGKRWSLPILGLLVAFPSAPGAAAALPIGAVTGNGLTRVNGAPVPSGAVLYSGDQISTGSSARATIHLRKNDELSLGRSTDVRITARREGYLVQLNRGKVAAISRADTPIVVRAAGITVEPARTGGFYQAAWRGNELKVFTRRGVTLVKGAGRPVEVAAGSLLKVSLARAGASRKNGKWLMVTMISGAAAAAAAGTGLAVAATGATCVSPSHLTCP